MSDRAARRAARDRQESEWALAAPPPDPSGAPRIPHTTRRQERNADRAEAPRPSHPDGDALLARASALRERACERRTALAATARGEPPPLHGEPIGEPIAFGRRRLHVLLLCSPTRIRLSRWHQNLGGAWWPERGAYEMYGGAVDRLARAVVLACESAARWTAAGGGTPDAPAVSKLPLGRVPLNDGAELRLALFEKGNRPWLRLGRWTPGDHGDLFEERPQHVDLPEFARLAATIAQACERVAQEHA